MTRMTGGKVKRRLPVALAAGALLTATLALAAVSGSAYADGHRRGGERGEWHHEGHRGGGWNGGYYRAPPVVYGSPYYYAPPVVYGSPFGLNINIR